MGCRAAFAERKHLNVLTVVRWPVGGIRTYLKYTYPLVAREIPDFEVTLVVPAVEEIAALRRDLATVNVKFILVSERCSFKEFVDAVRAELRTQNFDLIHSHGFTAAAATTLFARLKGVPHITTLHDILQRSQFRGFKGWLKLTGLRLFLASINVVQAVGNDARDNLVEVVGGSVGRRVVVIRNGIATDHFLKSSGHDLKQELKLPRETLLIGFFGRFMAQKGFKYLVEAVHTLETQHPGSVRVVTFGAGAFIREEMAAIERLGLAHCFFFQPFSPDVGGLLKSVDVVAIPSLWEAMPLLPMEALVCGAPIVGTDCIGLKEALADSPAHVVPKANAAQLAAALLHEKSKSTRAAAQNFSVEAARRFSVERSA